MAFFAIALGVGVAVSVGTAVYAGVKQKENSDQMVKNQEKNQLDQARVVYGTALATVPGSIPI
jgi:hypothetical protein